MDRMNAENEETSEAESPEDGEGFSELIRYTLPGYFLGLLAGIFLDSQGLQRSPLGQWFVRTLAGEGESIFEGIFSIKKRLMRAEGSMAEAYGWGKFFGISIPWIIDLFSRMAGVDVYGVEGFYIPYFYALSDQIGASLSGLFFLRRKEGSWKAGIRQYIHHPVQNSWV